MEQTFNHTQTPITWDYLAGLIETDGTFKMSLTSKGLYKPIISISQKKNTGLLDAIQKFLILFQINATFDISNAKRSNRAPQLRIQGRLQVLHFCERLEKNVKGTLFCSQKYRDFLIIKTALSNLTLAFAKKIDLILSLHKTHLDQLDVASYRTKTSRLNHERRLGLPTNSSKKAAFDLLQQIDLQFNVHQQKIKNALNNKTKLFTEDWCVGVMDGDGSFSVGFGFHKTPTGKKTIRFYPSFNLCMEIEAELTLKTFLFNVDCEGRRCLHLNETKEQKAIEYIIGREKELIKLLSFFKKAVPRNKVKVEQVSLLTHFFKLKKKKTLTDYETVSILIKQCYYVNSLGKAKGRLKYTLDEALEKTYDWLKK